MEAALQAVLRENDQITASTDHISEYFRRLVEQALRRMRRFGQAHVQIFGSFASGLRISASSDVDMNVSIPDYDKEACEAARELERLSKLYGEDVDAIKEYGKAAKALKQAAAMRNQALQKLEGQLRSGKPPDIVKKTESRIAALDEELALATRREASARARVSPQTKQRVLLIEQAQSRKSRCKKIVYAIVSAIRQDSLLCGYMEAQPVWRARVPVVKCVSSDGAVTLDIVPGNLTAVHNSRLLREYCTSSPLCRQLILLVKMWAAAREVNKAHSGLLSSYGHSLSVIHFLLQRTPPLLRDLQDPELITTLPPNFCNGLDVRFLTAEQAAQLRAPLDAPLPDNPALADLARDYFAYMHTCCTGQNVSNTLTVRPCGEGGGPRAARYRFPRAQWQSTSKRTHDRRAPVRWHGGASSVLVQ